MNEDVLTTVELVSPPDYTMPARADHAPADSVANGLAVVELPLAPGAGEPTAGGNGSWVATLPISPPLLPLPALRRLASGRCRGRTSAFQLELRVDIDRAQPIKQLSGDFCSFSEATTDYAGSFVVRNPTLMVTPNEIKIRGRGSYTFIVGFPIVEVTIERPRPHQSSTPAVVQFFSQTNALGATYICV